MGQLRSGISRYTVSVPVLLFAALALAAPNFLDGQNLSNLSGQMTALLLVTLGQLAVCLVAGIDLSVGSVVSLASCIAAPQSDPLVLILLALALALGVGLVNGCGVALAGIHPLIMTLSSMTFLQGLAPLVLAIPGGGVPPFLLRVAKATILDMPASLIWCAAAMTLLAVLLHRTWLGLHVFAVDANESSARLSGVRSRRVTVISLCAVQPPLRRCRPLSERPPFDRRCVVVNVDVFVDHRDVLVAHVGGGRRLSRIRLRLVTPSSCRRGAHQRKSKCGAAGRVRHRPQASVVGFDD